MEMGKARGYPQQRPAVALRPHAAGAAEPTRRALGRLPSLQGAAMAALGVAAFISLLTHVPFLFPARYEIDAFDQSLYIFRGRAIVEHLLAGAVWLPDPAWNPLGSLLYALAYLPFRTQEAWFLFVEWTVRCLLYGLLWAAALSVALALRRHAQPLWLLGTCAALPVFPFVLANSSDTLMAALSGLALGQVLRYHQSGGHGHLAGASVFLGLGTLSRTDSVVLMGVALVFVAARAFWGAAADRRRRLAGAAATLVLPALAILGSYQALHSAFSGQLSTNLAARTYMAFEQGEGFASVESVPASFERTLDARRLYGTPEENGYSVFRAIARNPGAYADRVVRIVTDGIPSALWYMYGPFTVWLAVPLAAAGAVALWRRRQRGTVALLALWPAHLAVYFLTFFRPGYLALPAMALLSAVAMGASALSAWLPALRWRPLAAFAVAGLIVFQAVLLHTYNFPQGRLPRVYATAEEEAAAVMRDTFPPGTRVATFGPRAVWQAGLEPVPTGVPIRVDGMVPTIGDLELMQAGHVEDLVRWMRERDVAAVYTGPLMEAWQPRLYALVEQAAGKELEVVFTAHETAPRALGYLRLLAGTPDVEGTVRVLRLRPA